MDAISPARDGLGESEALMQDTRRQRLHGVLAGGVSYALDALLFALFANAGRVPYAVALWYLVAAIGITAVFALIHLSGIAEQRRDPWLVIEQMTAALVLQLATIYVAPGLTMYCMGLTFLIFAFGISRLSAIQAVGIWALSTAALGAVLVRHDFQIASNFGTPFEGILAWISYATILLRGIGVSIYANAARHRTFLQKLQAAREAENASALETHDPQTGALKRQAILPMIEHQISLAGRSKEAFAVCMLEVDHFGLVTDHFGASVGNRVLGQLVMTTRDILRTSDQIGRYGSGEFLVLLPGSSGHEAISVIERVRHGIEQHAWGDLAPGLEIRISAGIVPFAPGDTVEKLVSKADYGLYKAKNGGRNRVIYVGGE